MYSDKEYSIQYPTIYDIDDLIENKEYLDLRDLKTYTIDDAKTIEIDDAISLECNGIIWIHIASPAEIIDLESDLSTKALSRACTIYNLSLIHI